MADPTRENIFIYRTGEKFPPHKYDPTATPDTTVSVVSRRNGQLRMARRVVKPTLVRNESRPPGPGAPPEGRVAA